MLDAATIVEVSMRAMLLKAPGRAPENMAIADVPEPAPGPGEVLVEVAYGGCNFADTMMRSGTYPHPKGYPIVAGLEVAGRVVGLGPGVEGLRSGDRVSGFSETAGGFAERCTVPAERLIRLPDGVGLDVAAAFTVQALTAWNLLHMVSRTAAGEVLLVHAAGGGVGLYLTQLAVKAGATVIGTVGTAGKEKRALEYGAARVVNREEEDFVEAVMAFTGGRGVDKIVDSTGASILDRSFATIRQLGHVLSYGEAEGRPMPNLWERLVAKSLTFTRYHLGHSDFRSASWREGTAAVLAGVADGSLKVPIEQVFPFEQAGRMYDRLESRQVAGKLLLAVRPA
jgi:NADPH2:quinone reductase